MQPRERYLFHGPDGFGDNELVALVLDGGSIGRSAPDMARDLLHELGGIGGLSCAPVQALAQVEGVGPARAVRVHAACALARRLVTERFDVTVIHGASDAFALFQPRLAGLSREELHAVYLNRRNAVLCYQVLTRGNDAHTIVDPRQVFRVAVQVGAAAVLVAHNHPSGDSTPSLADVEVTQRLMDAGRVLGVEVLDHLVLAGGGFRSMREEGLICCHHVAGASVAASKWVRAGT